MSDAYFFWKDYLGTSIRSGTIPFWNPYNFSGTPFLAHPNINIFYPPNWLFIFLPLNLAFSWYFFLHILIAGYTMYWLARSYKADKLASLISAVSFSLGGFFMARIFSGHLEYVDAASWVPLTFGLSRLAILNSSRKNILLAVFGWAVLNLSGNELFFLFTIELFGLYGIYQILFSRKRAELFKNFLKLAFLGVPLALGLTAVEFLPRFQFISASIRSFGVPYGIASSGSLPWQGLLLFISPFMWGAPFRGLNPYNGPWPNLFEYTHYIGIFPFIAILLFISYSGLKLIKRENIKDGLSKEINFFIFLVIPVFIIISLGLNFTPNIHKLLWQYSYFYKGLRFPVRHLFVVAFAATLASGLIISRVKKVYAKIIILFFVVLNLFIFDQYFFRITDIPTTTFDKKLINYLAQEKDVVRILPDFPVTSSVRRDLDFGAATMYKLQTTSDYNSMILKNYYEAVDAFNKAKASSLVYYNVEIPPLSLKSPYLPFLNIKYILADKLQDQVQLNNIKSLKLVLEGADFRLYENSFYLPRFFLVGKVKTFNNEEEIKNEIIDGNPDLAKVILLSGKEYKGALNLECNKDNLGRIEIVSYKINKIILDVEANCNSILSSSEIYYPGWQAKVDGRMSQIFRSNLAFRALMVPSGKHTVEIYYSPRIYYLGALVSIFSLVLIYIYTKRR